MHELIAILLVETNCLVFLFVQHAMLEENEDLHEKVGYFENKEWL
jgi:hypothetical protein